MVVRKWGWALAISLIGCGTPAPQSQASTTESGTQAPLPPIPTDGAVAMLGMTGPDKPWDSMNAEEKEWYMVGKVHPIMRQIFQTYNEKKYEGLNFECTPCHAHNSKETGYKMPNPELSAVPDPKSPEFQEMAKSRFVRFMMDRVVPITAHLLGEAPYDVTTGKGFSCDGCHPRG